MYRYEDKSFNNIMSDLLGRVSDDIDKREGSIIYDALAPAARELEEIYMLLDDLLNDAFIDTAGDEFLTQRASEFGVNRKAATRTLRKGIFTGTTPIVGDRFGLNDLTYIVTDNSGGIDNVILQCEQVGIQGNQDFGSLLPITVINNLTSATLSDVLVPGEDTETDDELRARYKETVNNPVYSGNQSHYIEWANEVDGVGDAQVIPVWSGANTVKVVIVDADKKASTPTLVTNVQTYIDPNQNGDGLGQAPIGAIVTVVSAIEKLINVSADVTISGGYTLPGVTTAFETLLTNYLKDIAFSNDTTVKYSKIGGLLLDTPGITDYTSLTVNGTTSNISVLDTEVGVKGTVSLT